MFDGQHTPTRQRRWVIWAGGVLAGVMAISSCGSSAGAAGDEDTDVTIEQVVEVSPLEAAEAAVGETNLGFLTGGQLVDLVVLTCESMTGETQTKEVARQVADALTAENEDLTDTQFRTASDSLASMLPSACPDAVGAHPELINGLVALSPATTTTSTTTTTTTTPPTTAPPATAPPTTPPPPPTTPPPPPPPPAASASYANCTEARAAGVTPLYRGDPGYASKLDRDDDGVACE